MKLLLFAIFTLLIGLSLTIGTHAHEKEKTERKSHLKRFRKRFQPHPFKNVDDGKPVNSVCPVSGEEVDPEVTDAYNGKTYGLCCTKC